MLYNDINATIVNNIKLPKNVLKREDIISGIKYNINHNNINIVNNPITFVLFSSLNIFFIFVIFIEFIIFIEFVIFIDLGSFIYY